MPTSRIVRVDDTILAVTRQALIEKLAPRLALDAETREFADLDFVQRFGVGLGRVSETALLNVALQALCVQLESQPAGKTGTHFFDQVPIDSRK